MGSDQTAKVLDNAPGIDVQHNDDLALTSQSYDQSMSSP